MATAPQLEPKSIPDNGVWIDGGIMIRAVDDWGDPVELSINELEHLAQFLIEVAAKYRRRDAG